MIDHARRILWDQHNRTWIGSVQFSRDWLLSAWLWRRRWRGPVFVQLRTDRRVAESHAVAPGNQCVYLPVSALSEVIALLADAHAVARELDDQPPQAPRCRSARGGEVQA